VKARRANPGGAAAEMGRIASALADRPDERVAAWETAARRSAAEFWARSAVRISIGPSTTREEIQGFLAAMTEAVGDVGGGAPGEQGVSGSAVEAVAGRVLRVEGGDQPAAEELAAHIPETASYLERLKQLAAESSGIGNEKSARQRQDVIIVDFYLTNSQHETVMKALESISREYSLTDASSALAKMAELHLTSAQG
jgi:hypothetical protein